MALVLVALLGGRAAPISPRLQPLTGTSPHGPLEQSPPSCSGCPTGLSLTGGARMDTWYQLPYDSPCPALLVRLTHGGTLSQAEQQAFFSKEPWSALPRSPLKVSERVSHSVVSDSL